MASWIRIKVKMACTPRLNQVRRSAVRRSVGGGLCKVQKREGVAKRGRKPGRKANPTKTDMKIKLERSRQSARECRARKKLRYQYLEEQVAHREKAVFMLHEELEQYRKWAREFDEGKMPEGLAKLYEEEKERKAAEED